MIVRKIPTPFLVLLVALSLLGSNAVLFAQSAESYPGQAAIQQMFDAQAQRAKDFAPKVLTLKSGVQIQRTPSEYNAGVYHSPGKSISYNTYYLDADSRGCGACQKDCPARRKGKAIFVHGVPRQTPAKDAAA